MEFTFKKAIPVWFPKKKFPGEEHVWNQFAGFHTCLNISERKTVTLAICACSYYRLYINGTMEAHGPARTAKGYGRVDELTLALEPGAEIAVEVAAYNKPDRYSNTISLDPGMFICEITCGKDILSATGWTDSPAPWKVCELFYRRGNVELMSHSREIMEVYDLTQDWLDWTKGVGAFAAPEPVPQQERPVFLKRRAPYPDYMPIQASALLKAGDIIPQPADESCVDLQKFMQPAWYDQLGDLIVPSIESESFGRFSGTIQIKGEGLELTPGPEHDCYVLWDLKEAVTGFIRISLKIEQECVVDVLNSDRLDQNGIPRQNAIIRYHLKAGTYELTTYEPYFFRYIKLVLRGKGTANIYSVKAVTWWYPDHFRGTFASSDGQLNRIFEAARRTLQANTLDIFMDCPQRERGGWLCDSLWSGRAARMLFGDLSVEEDFIENFMLTDPDFYKNAFFPEVYPGNSRDDSGDPGILNWSFWLGLEVCEYYRRSGNREMLKAWYPRICRFVEGTRAWIGESGLLENLSGIFVDWSQSNLATNTQPISLPVNCLYAHMLEELAKVYDQPQWAAMAKAHWDILKNVPEAMCFGPSGRIPANYADALTYENGEFKPGQTLTEAAMFLDVWCGLDKKTKKPEFTRNVIDTMGTCSREPGNIMVGRSDLFIGLTIRYDVLSREGEAEQMIRELKDVYLKQLDMGPGTLFENTTGYASRCHGFNGHAGVLLMRDVLGLHEPDALTHTVRIQPHLCGLKWASGKTVCGDSYVMVQWQADAPKKCFKLDVYCPEGYTPEVILPPEISGWQVEVTGV